MKKLLVLAVLAASLFNASCRSSVQGQPEDGVRSTAVVVANPTSQAATVYVAFGADSVVLPPAWSFCTNSTNLTCQFPLGATSSITLPIAGKYMNATMAFNSPVGCGSTKAEINVNNPRWYDVLDISLVDGWNVNISIDVRGVSPVKLGPTLGRSGNEKVVGVFPYGCDICVARQNPPCGIPKGTDGCKSGSQYNPDVICQWQGPKKGGGGSLVAVSLR